MNLAIIEQVMMRSQSLSCHVVFIESEVAGLDRERPDALARRQSLKVRYPDLDNETTTRLEVPRGIAEAIDLFVLRGEVADGVID